MPSSAASPSPPPTAPPSIGPTPSELGPSPTPGALTPPSTQDLIAAALQAGRIDYPTSLLYRAYAAFWDNRLPVEYVGASEDEDDMVLAEAARFAAQNPAAVPRELSAFLVRPTIADSVFTGPASDAGAVDLAAAHLPAPNPRDPLAVDMLCNSNGWASLLSFAHSGELRVWASCTGRGAADYQAAMVNVLEILDEHWAPMTTDMGMPASDVVQGADPATYGGDGAIDVYLVYPGQRCPRQQTGGGATPAPCESISGSTLAATVPQPPLINFGSGHGTTSAYMLVRRDRLDANSASNCPIRTDLAHEFFHVLQDAHNSEIQFQGQVENWFVEASATWAESAYERSCAAAQTYVPRFAGFQAMPLPLQSANRVHTYRSFIWPFFMEMEQENGVNAVPDVWKALDDKTTWDEVRDAIDGELSFEKKFREFALRNLDRPFEPGTGLDKTYQSFDPNFPVDLQPYYAPYLGSDPRVQLKEDHDGNLLVLNASTADGSPVAIAASGPLRQLAGRYYRFQPQDALDPHAPKVGQIVFDFSQLTGVGGDLDVDFVVGIRDSSSPTGTRWERRKLEEPSPSGQNMPPHQYRFCRTVKSDLVDQIYLVLSNHQKDENAAPISGQFTVQPLAEPCLFGDMSLHYHQTSSGENGDMAEMEYTIDLHVDARFANGGWVTSGGTWNITGSGTQSKAMSDCTPIRQEHYTFGGSGTWIPPGGTLSGAAGEGFFNFAVINSAPLVNIQINTNQTWSDACIDHGPVITISFDWGGDGDPCTLDKLAGVPCVIAGSGPGTVGPDETGPYDVSGKYTLTESPLSGTNTREYEVVGVLGGSPSDTP